MELPGLRSLFTRLNLRFGATSGDSSELWYRARTTRFDSQFRILDTSVDVATSDGRLVAQGELRSYVRFSPLVTDLADLAARVESCASRLGGKTALVCGGSRGLGADITAALALAGCRVYASSRGGLESAQDLTRRLAQQGVQVEFLRGDAGDLAWCSSALDRIRERHGRLDILVLNACAPAVSLRVSPDSAVRFEDYVSRNLLLASRPLATFLPLLDASRGAVVGISSSVVQEPMPGFAHYVALKQAVEGTIRTAALEFSGLFSLIARPSRLLTSWNDAPTRVLGAIPADWVASHIVNRLAQEWRPGRVEVLADFPAPHTVKREGSETQESEFTLALSASFTAEPLLPGLRFWLQELGIQAHAEIAPYGQVIQELLNPSSGLSTNARGMNVVLLRVRDWLRDLPKAEAGSSDFLRQFLRNTAGEFALAMRTHRSHAKVETLLVICPSHGSSNSDEDELLARSESGLLDALHDVPGLQLVVASDFHPSYLVQQEQVNDPLRDHIAHVPYQDAYFHVLATLIIRRFHRRLALLRKVIVVDCDNTLWRGVVGEAGAEGIEIDRQHRELHAVLARLSQNGWLVCLCSKNAESDVWGVFEGRKDVGLRREQIVAAMINWQPKSENLRVLASRLNLGLDSFVFIDDNPVECAEVRASCPEVLALEWPQDCEQALRLLRHTWELDSVEGTKEDKRRSQLYREEFHRQELKAESLSFRDFINSLDLNVDIALLAPEDLRRASQLTLRTNQFNFTTRRREESDMQSLVAGERHEIRTVKVRDRFGDYGLVGLIIAEARNETLVVDTFLLSCRVLGRGVEHRMASELGRLALAGGSKSVRLRVEATQRNAPARAFLEAIVPAEFREASEAVLACDVPAVYFAEVRFEPGDQDHGRVDDAERKEVSRARMSDGGDPRTRERQIARAAYELSTAEDLRTAIEGARVREVPTHVPDVMAANDVGAVVYEVVAQAVKLPASKVRELDTLEALGCDSFKVVEITVELVAKFPWLPSTLLFEHRSVAEIIRHIAELLQAERAPVEARVVERASAADHTESAPDTEVAVVGMGVRCAGARSVAQLWELLSAGSTAVERVNPARACFIGNLHDNRTHWAGLLDDVDGFDAEFFGVSPREAELMDPQLRLFLEVAWEALEDAGCTGRDLDVDTGVFAGVMYGDYGHRANRAAGATESPYKCWESFSLANRLSQLLGLRGPSLAVDTACSSSGTALHLACRALNAGDCKTAIVGGVNLILDPDRFAQLGRLGILSASGRCRPFGAESDGTVLGEGVGVVVVRPLREALRRGDRIYGVIRGTGLSTGSGTVGFTAPNPQAQAEAIQRSLAAARVDPRTVTYVETHGTGTSLGDPIEVRGLTLAYSNQELWDNRIQGANRCRIGAIKPNVGHLEAGAAVVGLIKVLLQLERGMLLPSLSSTVPNPQIPFATLPFEVQRKLEPWSRALMEVDGATASIPRRAGVSSFGVGGANAHIIVEEAPVAAREEPQTVERPRHLLTASARSAESLRDVVANLKLHLEACADLPLEDVCYTTNVGRKHFEHRLVVTAARPEHAIGSLAKFLAGEEPAGCARGTVPRSGAPPKVAFLFTGQGSQYAGMGRILYETQPVFREALDRCTRVLDPLLETPLIRVLFAEEGSVEAALLDQTGYTQPALFAFEYALSELWRSWGVQPDVVMGHSVGELAAMCVAGSLSLDDGLKLVAARGQLMQSLPAGGVMSSVMAGETRVLEAIAGCKERVSIAAINGPQHVVISGDGRAVEEVTEKLRAERVKTKSLTVSHAFHSPLMEPMLTQFEAVLREVSVSRPRIPLVSCVNGALVTDELGSLDYRLRQVRDPVRFSAGIATLTQLGIKTYVEVGPQPVLLGMARLCVSEKEGDDDEKMMWLASLRKDADPWETLLGSVAKLHVRGAAIDWKGFDAPYGRRKVPLPSYPFRHKRFWIDGPAEVRVDPDIQDQRLLQRLYEVVWRESRRAEDGRRSAAAGRWLVLADRGGMGSKLAGLLGGRSCPCTTVLPGESFRRERDGSFRVNPSSPGDFERLWQAVAVEGGPIRGAVHLWSLDVPSFESFSVEGVEALRRLSLESAVHLAQVLTQGGEPRSTLWLVTRGAVATGQTPGREPLSISQAPLWGLGRTMALEHPEIWGGLLDLSANGGEGIELEALVQELLAPDGEDQVTLRGGKRFVPRLVRRGPKSSGRVSLSGEGTYLVTGGLGALGVRVAKWLVSKGARHVVLASRKGAAAPSAEEVVRCLEALGAAVVVAAVDVARAEDLSRLIDTINAGPAPLRGVVHAAGIDAAAPIKDLTPRQLQSVIAPKIEGGMLLHERTRVLDLDLFVCFSSISAVLGYAGHAHYGAANAFLDALAQERRRLGLPALSVGWGPWKGGGMASEETLRHFEQLGNRGLDPHEALLALEALIGGGETQAVVADLDWERFRPVYEAQRKRPIVSDVGDTPTAAAKRVRGGVCTGGEDARLDSPREYTAAEMTSLVRSELARTLGFVGPEEVHLDKTFYAMGMDSLLAVEFANRLEERLGLRSHAFVYDFPYVESLAQHLLEQLGSSRPPRTGGVATASRVDGAEQVARVSCGEAPEWVGRIENTPPARRAAVLADLLRQEVAETLGFSSPEEVPLDRTFSDMGMDSLMAVEFSIRLQKRIGVRGPGWVFDYPNVEALAAHLLSKVLLPETPVVAGFQPKTNSQAIVGYSPELEEQVFSFCELAWPHRRHDWLGPRWRWMFVESAKRLGVEPRVWLYCDSGEVVAHHGAIPVRLKVAAEEHQTAWFVETMVLEKYRSKAVGSRLFVRGSEDLPFGLSLGQSAEAREIVLRLGWEEVAPLETAQFLIRPEAVLRGKLAKPAALTVGWALRAIRTVQALLRPRSRAETREVTRFDARHDQLWETVARDMTCCVVRDASYLNWKYVDQPGQTFVRLEVVEGEAVRGVAVLMFREADGVYGYRRAFLVDLVAPLSDGRLLQKLLAVAIRSAAELGADSLVCMHIDRRLTRALRRMGFLIRKPTRFLLVYPGPLPEEPRRHVLAGDQWYVTQGDSDIDRPW
jgi:FkbH-like protein